MNKPTDPLNQRGNPGEAYRDELENKGSTFKDTPAESDARDAAKLEKAETGYGQKMDGGQPFDGDDDQIAEEIRRETLEKK